MRIAIWLVIGVAASLATTGPGPSQATDDLPPEPAGFELDGDIDNGELVFKQCCQK
jgi:hypothetical protein